jgi:Ca2+-binding RTX toxin-like protein
VGKSITVTASYLDGYGTAENIISNASGIVTGFLLGTDQPDTLVGTDVTDEIHGLAGDDFIYGGDGLDELDGGVGNDLLDGGAGDDILRADSNGYSQLSNISGSFGIDTLIGGAGNDIAYMRFEEQHYFFSRNDTAIILTNKTDASSVTMIDRTSLNGVELISFNKGVAFNLSDLLSGIATSGNDNLYQRTSLVGSGGFVIDGLEGNDLIKGSHFADQLSGGNDKDFLVGFSDDDTLSGGHGRDCLSGGDGNDSLDGGSGADLLIGGSGDDIYVVDSLRDVIIEQSGWDTIKTLNLSEINLQRYRGIEAAEYTGTGSATLIGNQSNNSLVGNVGSDTLIGKFGNDTLTGAGGSDKFVFNAKLDAQFNFDQITDFSIGTDKLVLDKTIFTRFTSAVQSSNLVIGTDAQDSDDYLIYDSNTQTLYYDADGNTAGAKVAFAQLVGVNSLSSSDFSVI